MASIFSVQNLQTFLRRKNLRPPGPPGRGVRGAPACAGRDVEVGAGACCSVDCGVLVSSAMCGSLSGALYLRPLQTRDGVSEHPARLARTEVGKSDSWCVARCGIRQASQ